MNRLDQMGPFADAEVLGSSHALPERPNPGPDYPVFVTDIEFLIGAIHEGLGNGKLVSLSLIPNVAEFLLKQVADAAKYPPRSEADVFDEMSDDSALRLYNIVQRAGTAENGRWESLRRTAVTLAKRVE